MTVIRPSLFIVMKQFPDHKEVIKRLFMESENFRNICEDYRLCDEALRNWDHSTSEERTARREEYAAILRELEKEILENLLNSK
jgi:hypothetical protein